MCMVLAYAMGIVLMLLGIIGLFFGSSANFTLPPILGGVPFLIGWGIIVAIKIAWNQVGSASFSETLLNKQRDDDPELTDPYNEREDETT